MQGVESSERGKIPAPAVCEYLRRPRRAGTSIVAEGNIRSLLAGERGTITSRGNYSKMRRACALLDLVFVAFNDFETFLGVAYARAKIPFSAIKFTFCVVDPLVHIREPLIDISIKRAPRQEGAGNHPKR